MRIGSLFSGIGGLELGLERAGLGGVAWQVESNPQRRRVLAKHWPTVERFDDVRTFEGRPADLICGGFPCQDLSDASRRGDRPGLDGEKSGLWWHFLRIVCAVRPRWVVVENVDGAARKRWLPQVRRSLWRSGYASLPIRVRACDVGAPHVGARVFVVAKTDGQGQPASAIHAEMAELRGAAVASWTCWGQPSPTALGMADGVPRRMDRLAAAGNAVVPQCAEVIGRIIINNPRSKQP